MPWWTFTAYNVAGAVLWTCAWGLGTYYLGRDIHFIAAFFHRHRPLLLVLGATAFLLWWCICCAPRKVSECASETEGLQVISVRYSSVGIVKDVHSRN